MPTLGLAARARILSVALSTALVMPSVYHTILQPSLYLKFERIASLEEPAAHSSLLLFSDNNNASLVRVHTYIKTLCLCFFATSYYKSNSERCV